MLDKSWIVAKKASQRRAVCSDPNYALQSGIIGVKLGAGLLRTTENISVCNQPNTCCSFKKLHSTTLEDDNISMINMHVLRKLLKDLSVYYSLPH